MSHPTEGDKPYVLCAICAGPMDLLKSFKRDASCCCRGCALEFEWRYTLSILGKPYSLPKERAEAKGE